MLAVVGEREQSSFPHSSIQFVPSKIEKVIDGLAAMEVVLASVISGLCGIFATILAQRLTGSQGEHSSRAARSERRERLLICQ